MTGLGSMALEICNDRYFWENETKWSELSLRMAVENAKNETNNVQEYTDKVYNIINNMEFVPAGRILRNLGKIKPSTSNCNFIGMSDNIESIGETIAKYMVISAYGGGTGLTLSSLRPKGAILNTRGGESSGMLSFLDIFDVAGKRIMTGGARRAAGIALCDVSHPEIIDFINAKTKHDKYTQFNISVMINNRFLDAVEENKDWEFRFAGKVYGKIKAKILWDLILKNMLENSEPGLVNWDNLRKNNSHYFSPIEGVNPCSTGDTLVAVADGREAISIKKLAEEGKDVPVFCVDNKNKIVVQTMRHPRITGYNKKILKITLDNGGHIRCTENHKILTKEGEYKRADELKINDKLHHMIRFHASFEEIIKKSNSKSQNYIWVNNGEKSNLEHRLIIEHKLKRKLKNKEVVHHKDYIGINNKIDNLIVLSKQEHDILHSRDMIGNKNPVNRFPEKNWLIKQDWSGKKNGRWLGYIHEDIFKIMVESMILLERKITKDEWLEIAKRKKYPNSDFILGKFSSLNKMLVSASKKAKVYMKGHELREYKKYLKLKDNYDLPIYFKNGSIFIEKRCEKCNKKFEVKYFKREQAFCSRKCAGSSEKQRQNLREYYQQRKELKEIALNFKIVSIEEDGYENVYNGTVDKYHNFYTLVGEDKTDSKKLKYNYINNLQCGELPLENLGVCNLGSLVLTNFVANKNTNWLKLRKTIKLAIRFLDNIIDLAYYPIVGQEEVVKNARRIGLGTMGLADYLFMKEIRYGSQRALNEVEKLYKFIRDESYIASAELAKEKGAFPKYSQHEFLRASFVKKLPPKIRMFIKENAIRNVVMITAPPTGTTSLIAGVTSGIEPLPFKGYRRSDGVGDRYYIHPHAENNYDEDWFVDSYDLKPEEHLDMQITIQKYIDNGVSKTILLPKDATISDLSALLLEYCRDLKGVTVYRDESREKQVYYRLSRSEIKKYFVSASKDLDAEDVKCSTGSCDT